MPVGSVGTPQSANDIWRSYDKNYDRLTEDQRRFSMPPSQAPMQTATDPEGRKLSSRYIAGGADGKTPIDINKIKELAMLLTRGDVHWVPLESLGPGHAAETSVPTGGKVNPYTNTVHWGPPSIAMGKISSVPDALGRVVQGTLARSLPHETGHALDTVAGDLPYEPGSDKGGLSYQLDQDAGRDPELHRQFDSMHYGYEHPPNATEVIADALALYMVDPAGTKAKFPKAAKWLRDHINTDAMLNRILTLSQNNTAPQQAQVG